MFRFTLGLWLACLLVVILSGRDSSTPDAANDLNPPELACDLPAIPEDRNAWPMLQEALAEFVDWDKFEPDIEKNRPFMNALSWKTAAPTDEDSRRLREYLDRNEKCLHSLDEAIRRGQLQFPQPKGGKDIRLTVQPWHRLSWLKILKARLLVEKGGFADAARELRGLLRLGDMLCQANGLPGTFLRGGSILGDALTGYRALAAKKNVPPDLIRALLESLKEVHPLEDGFIRVTQLEFKQALLPSLEKLPGNGDLDQALEAMCSQLRPAKDPKAINRQIDKRQAALGQMLKDHPIAWNRAATIRLAASQAVVTVQNARRPWLDPLPDPLQAAREELAFWPETLSLEPMKMIPLFLGHEQEELPADEMRKLAQEARRVANPLGKHFLAGLVLADERRVLFVYRNRLEVTRAILALQVYLHEKGSLPSSPAEIVKQGILPQWPADPYDGKPLRYSADKAIVWSVGRDGIDHGGVREVRHGDLQFLNLFQPAGKRLPVPDMQLGDLVWSITDGE